MLASTGVRMLPMPTGRKIRKFSYTLVNAVIHAPTNFSTHANVSISRDAVASRRQVLRKNFLRRREATEYRYAKIPEMNFSVDNSRKRIVALDF